MTVPVKTKRTKQPPLLFCPFCTHRGTTPCRAAECLRLLKKNEDEPIPRPVPFEPPHRPCGGGRRVIRDTRGLS